MRPFSISRERVGAMIRRLFSDRPPLRRPSKIRKASISPPRPRRGRAGARSGCVWVGDRVDPQTLQSYTRFSAIE